MKLRPTLSAIAVLLATLLGGCGANRLLVGEGPMGAAGTGQSSSGGAGTGSSASGAAGTKMTGQGGSGVAPTGAAGAEGGTGAGGSASAQDHPLQISGADAITRIAQALWNDAPDADLMVQAQQGHFKNASDLSGAIQQMLVDSRAATGIGAFYRWWLDLDSLAKATRDPTLFPQFTPALGSDMAAETERFGVEVTLSENGTYQSLMTASYSWLNADLAAIYGVAGVTGDTLKKVAVPSDVRAGLLTQPAFLVTTSFAYRNSPSLRGTRVLQKFLCSTAVPPAPMNTPGLDPIAPGVSVRQALTQSTMQAGCAACHYLFDGPGLAFEGFDPIGRTRTIDNGALVDTSGLRMISQPDGSLVLLNGPLDLARFLSQAPAAWSCYARQWYAFLLHKTPQQIDDTLVSNTTSQAVQPRAGLKLQGLITAVLTSDAFLAPNLGLQ
jgi:hypothetical protein